MDVDVDLSQPYNQITSLNVRLSDYSDGSAGYLELAYWIKLSGGDELIAVADGKEYRHKSLEEGETSYSFDIPNLSAREIGIELRREEGASANTGHINLFYDLALERPIAEEVFQLSDPIDFEWSLGLMAETADLAQVQIYPSTQLQHCENASGNIVVDFDANVTPGGAIGFPFLTTDTMPSTAQQLLDVAISPAILATHPSAISCQLKLFVTTNHHFNETRSNSLINAYMDPELAMQDWSIKNTSNVANVTILLE